MSSAQRMAANVVGFIVAVIEGIAFWLSEVLKNALPSYCEIETADSDYVLVAKDQSLVSGIKIQGIVDTVGGEEFERLVSSITNAWSNILQAEGMTIQAWIEVNPDDSKQMVAKAQEGSLSAMKVIGLDAEDVINSRIDNLSKFVAPETAYLAVWTTPGVMSSKDLKEVNQVYAKDIKNIDPKVPLKTNNGQNLTATIPDLRERHESIVSAMVKELADAGVVAERITAHAMTRAGRIALDGTGTHEEWMPALPGDPIPKKMRGQGHLRDLGWEDLQYPTVSDQVFTRNAKRIGPAFNQKYVEIGDRVFAPLLVEIPPREIHPFSELFSRLKESKIPYRISFLIDGGGMRFVTSKGMFASFVRWGGSYNSNIKEAVDAMVETAKEESVVRVRIALATWASADDLNILRQRVNTLYQIASKWGHCEIREISGDPLEGLMPTIPFLSKQNPGNFAVGPLADIVRMLPLTRPASFWDKGAVLFRSQDGKLMPFQPASSQQTSSAIAIMAPPGRGKSVLLASILLGASLQPGNMKLPRIAIIDIGFSSKGLIRLIQDALPPDLKHQAIHVEMRNSRDYAINPMDLQLGAMFPTPEHKSFLISLITQLVTPAEKDRAYPSMSSLVSAIIDEAYQYYSDGRNSSPKRYSETACDVVEKCLQKYGFSERSHATWWEIRDFLFERGHVHEATLAQRYAVPTVEDLTQVVQNSASVRNYENVKIETNESLVAAFSRLLGDALKDISVLSGPTQFDIGDIRIGAIDIDAITKGISDSANWRRGIMYLLANFALSKDYKLLPDDLAIFRDLYKSYQSERISELRRDIKWKCYDEFHRTERSPATRDEVTKDLLEGRKFGVGIILASQSLQHFPQEVMNTCTGVFLLGAGSPQEAAKMQELLGFNATAKQLLLEKCNGPTNEGVPFLAIFTTKSGRSSQLLYSTIGSVEKWALSTTPVDVGVRDKLSAVIGQIEARRLLARVYPGGSAASEVERIRAHMADKISAGIQVRDPSDDVVDKLLGLHGQFTTAAV